MPGRTDDPGGLGRRIAKLEDRIEWLERRVRAKPDGDAVDSAAAGLPRISVAGNKASLTAGTSFHSQAYFEIDAELDLDWSQDNGFGFDTIGTGGVGIIDDGTKVIVLQDGIYTCQAAVELFAFTADAADTGLVVLEVDKGAYGASEGMFYEGGARQRTGLSIIEYAASPTWTSWMRAGGSFAFRGCLTDHTWGYDFSAFIQQIR